jgi:transposase-like protein
MYREQTIRKRYTEAFKQKLISDIENGKLTIAQARVKYDIRGSWTIQGWMKKAGKTHLLDKVVRIQLPEEIDRIQQLKREKQKLETALARAYLKIDALEQVIELAEKDYKTDLKKSTAPKRSRRK